MDEVNKAKLTLLIALIHDCIKEAGDQGIPSGHLYAMLLGKVHLHVYQQIVDALVSTNKITNKGHLLKAVS